MNNKINILWTIWIYILCTFLSYNANSQDQHNRTIDSIHQLLFENVKSNYSQNHPASYGNPDSNIIYLNGILQQSIKAKYTDGAFYALIQLSIKYYEKEDFVNCRKCCFDALPWAEKSTIKDGVAWCYDNIGDSWFFEGDYLQASAYYYKGLDDLNLKHQSPTHVTANIYNSLGQVNIRLGQREKGLEFFNEAEKISREYGLDYQLGNALANKGSYYLDKNMPDSAMKYYREELELGKKMHKEDLLSIAYTGTGNAMVAKKQYNDALPMLKNAIDLSKANYPFIHVDALYAMGDCLYHLGKYHDAEDLLLSALHETKAHNYRDNYIKCYSKLVGVYKAMGNTGMALAYTDSLMMVKDSLAGNEKAMAVNQLELKYATAEKDKQIAENKLLIEQQKSKLARKNGWIAGITAIIVVLLTLMAAYYLNNRNRQKLQHEQILSLQQQNTIGILKGIVQGEEKERSRIARELHDGIGGLLSAAMMRLSAVRVNNNALNQLPEYQEVMGLLDEAGDEIRKTAHNLMPESLTKQPLTSAIASYCRHMSDSNAILIDYQAIGDLTTLSEDSKLNIYRILQELLKNVVRHSQASHALVQLITNGQTLNITVEDNGIGFDSSTVQKGMGLNNLETRIKSMYGNYSFESLPGKGTSVYIEFEMNKLSVNDTA